MGNKAVRKLLDQLDEAGGALLSVDYVNNKGLVQLDDGTPVSIMFSEETQEWA